MSEFLEACVQSPVNLALSIMLLAAMGYWLIALLAGLGLDSLDFDLDMDGNADLDIDVPAGSGAGVGMSILRGMGFGEVPVLVLLTIFLLILWAIGVLSYPVMGQWSIGLQVLAVIPAAIVASLTTTLATWPLRIVFRKMKARELAEQKFEFVGKRVRVVSTSVDAKQGQAEIDTAGAPLRINIRLHDTDTTLNKNDEAVIVAEDAGKGLYFVQPF